MKPTPKGWPRMSQAIYYRDARAAIDWLCRAFGFEVRELVEGPDGAIVHSELTFGEALMMIGATGKSDPGKESWQTHQKSPLDLGGANTQSVCLYVDDVDEHHARAASQGATITRAPQTTDYGEGYWVDRSYGALDPEGHLWWFMQRLETRRPA